MNFGLFSVKSRYLLWKRPKGPKILSKMPNLNFFVAKNPEYDHSHPVWYLDFSFGTKNCQLRLVGDLQNAAIKAMQNYYNYTISLTYRHGSIVSFFLLKSPMVVSRQYLNCLNVQSVDQRSCNCLAKSDFS